MMASNESEVCYHPETFFICRRLQKNTLMYTQFFGLSEHPFSISPNPKYLYMSERHGEALAHLNYGLQDGGGFVLLTGEVGTGKTEIAYILNPSLTERDLLAAICDEFQLPYPEDAGIKRLFDLIRDHLLANLAAGKRSVVLVDEAQHLLPGVLEQLRLLTNLETDERKLLQVVLIGQPELQQMLRQPLLRQLARDRNIALADHYNALIGNWPKLTYEGLHPNLAGYEVMARTWFTPVNDKINAMTSLPWLMLLLD